jgi:Ca-activated chloride channel family protein
MRFADPLWLVLLLVPLALGWRWWRARRAAPEGYIGSSAASWFLRDLPRSRRARMRPLLDVLRFAAMILLPIALARPQVPRDVREVKLRSRNIVVALDISSSMKATDFKPGNRLEVAKRVLKEFVAERDGDLVGLVIFAGRPFLQAPLTPDVGLLSRMIDQVDIGLLPDGTAIGTALALGLNQLKTLPPKASVIVILTDGANNTGEPSPFVAAEAARALGVRIHTIGLAGKDTSSENDGYVWRAGREADRLTASDEAVLKRIAERTGGRYFRASDPDALRRIMAEIDPLEKRDVPVAELRNWRELYAIALVPALLSLVLEAALGATWLRTVP